MCKHLDPHNSKNLNEKLKPNFRFTNVPLCKREILKNCNDQRHCSFELVNDHYAKMNI